MKIRGSVVSSSFIFPHPPEDKKKEKKHTQENTSNLSHPRAWIEINFSALSLTLMWPCPERRGVIVGCFYLEIDRRRTTVFGGQCCSRLNEKLTIWSVGPHDWWKKQKRKKKKSLSDVTRNIQQITPPKKIYTFWPNYRLSISISLIKGGTNHENGALERSFASRYMERYFSHRDVSIGTSLQNFPSTHHSRSFFLVIEIFPRMTHNHSRSFHRWTHHSRYCHRHITRDISFYPSRWHISRNISKGRHITRDISIDTSLDVSQVNGFSDDETRRPSCASLEILIFGHRDLSIYDTQSLEIFP